MRRAPLPRGSRLGRCEPAPSPRSSGASPAWGSQPGATGSGAGAASPVLGHAPLPGLRPALTREHSPGVPRRAAPRVAAGALESAARGGDREGPKLQDSRPARGGAEGGGGWRALRQEIAFQGSSGPGLRLGGLPVSSLRVKVVAAKGAAKDEA